MDIMNVKSKKADDRTEIIDIEHRKTKDKPLIKEVKMSKGFQERIQKSREKKLEKLQLKHEYLEKKYGTQIKSQELKTRIAEMKQKQRAASPLRHIPAGLSKVFTTRGTREREQAVSAQQRAVRSERQMSRQQMEQEREYHRKFPVRQEGDGELPYYELEHKRPLPKKECSPRIGITSGERIPKKKSLKDELF